MASLNLVHNAYMTAANQGWQLIKHRCCLSI
jgi:hypothetical protein